MVASGTVVAVKGKGFLRSLDWFETVSGDTTPMLFRKMISITVCVNVFQDAYVYYAWLFFFILLDIWAGV